MTAEDVEGFLSPAQQKEDEYDVTQAGCVNTVSSFKVTGEDLSGETNRLRLALRVFSRETPWVLELSLL
jgi:hypothetical protein